VRKRIVGLGRALRRRLAEEERKRQEAEEREAWEGSVSAGPRVPPDCCSRWRQVLRRRATLKRLLDLAGPVEEDPVLSDRRHAPDLPPAPPEIDERRAWDDHGDTVGERRPA
jgi:hypothetical protein